MRQVRFLIVIASLLVFLTGCMGANEEFIQGEWMYSDPHLANLPAEPHATSIWNFNGGYFYNFYCCFNESSEMNGNYRIVSDEGNVLILELYNVQGSEVIGDGGQIRVEIDTQNGTITIYDAGPYERITPQYSSDG